MNNRQFHRFINDGVPIKTRIDGKIKGDFVKVIDFNNIGNNDFLIANQFTIHGNNGTLTI